MRQVIQEGINTAAFVLWFTGLSGSGKTTVAKQVSNELRSRTPQPVELIDGDVFRATVSRDLSFSKQDRYRHICRMANSAGSLASSGVATLVAAISPYRVCREQARKIVGPDHFIEVYCSASLQICSERDPKGLYAKAREGLITNFTGVSDPYEVPQAPDIVLDTANEDPQACVESVLDYLASKRYVS